jgi:VCBS repeat-containing protein
VPVPSASTLQPASGERFELSRGTRADTFAESAPVVEAPASVGALIDSSYLGSPAAASVPTPVSAPLIVAPSVAAQPVMLAAPKPAAASGRVESVWAPLLGNGPASPVQSPVSWVMLAAARRELDAPKAVKAPAAAVSTGQPVAPAATTVAVPGAAATNSAPVISSVTLSAPNTTTGAVTGTVKASDPNGDKMTYKATVASAAKGTVAITTAGVFTYTPTSTARHSAAKVGATTAVTTDTVTVTVTDAKGAAVTRAVSVPVSPKNAAPSGGKATVGSPNATTGVVTGTVTATDADKDPLAYSVPAATAKGTVAITAAGAFTYTPTAAARHTAARIGVTTADKADTFTVTVTDGYGGNLAVPVTVTISPKNTAPTATATIGKPDPVTGVAKGTVTATDADKDKLTYTATKPPNGTVTVNADGTFAYTPTATARASARISTTTKTDTFSITVADGHGGTKAVSVTATIAPSNSAPVAGTPTVSTNTTTGVVTGKVNATDPNKDPITYTAAATTTAKGTFAVTNTGDFTYTPTATARHAAARVGAPASDKAATVAVQVTDKYGAISTIPVTVAISPKNTAPVAGSTTTSTPNATTGVITGSVTATDADKDALTYSGSTNTSKGKVTVASNGTFTYTPTVTARHAAARTGASAGEKSDTFTITVADGYGASLPITVSVAISPSNKAPVASILTINAPDQTTGKVTGSVTVSDPDGDTVSYSLPTSTTKGSVAFGSDGTFSYTPTAAARNTAASSDATAADKTDTFTITFTDQYGGKTELPVAVPVSPKSLVAITAGLKGYVQSQPEGNSGITNIPVTVKLSAPSTQEVTVYYRVAESALNNAATPWSDYIPDSSSVVFSPGQTEATFNVRVYGDTEYERDEWVVVQLTGASGATLDAQGIVASGFTINNDDAPPASAALAAAPSPADQPIRLLRH